MVDDPRLILARKNEREARRRLEEGCASDLASMELLFAATMTLARQQLHDALAESGADLRSATELIAASCARRLRDSADVRFRARFRNYAEAVWQSEAHLLVPPRRIALPHVELEPPCAPPLPAKPEKLHVDEWLSQLSAALREALHGAVEIARRKAVRRVIASSARARAREFHRRSIAR
jgi:hypothetical protein